MYVLLIILGIAALSWATIGLLNELSKFPFDKLQGADWFRKSPQLQTFAFRRHLIAGAAGGLLLLIGFALEPKQLPQPAPSPTTRPPKEVHTDIAATNLPTCLNMIKSRLNHPSTFETGWLPAEAKDMGNGVTILIINFSAKNGLGAQTKMLGFCSIQASGEIKIMSIKER